MAVRAGQKELLDELEKRLEELRRKYELYFQGSKEQRTPPSHQQAQLGGEMRRIREEEVRTWNTQDKFRFNQIFARYVSIDRVWARTMRQIEDGTYKRDKLKLELNRKKQKEVPQDTQVQGRRPSDSLDGLDVDVGSFDDEGLINSLPPQRPVSSQPGSQSGPQPGAPPAQAPRPPPPRPQPAGGGDGMSEQRLRQLYDVYIQAKKRTGEASSLTLEGLKKQINQQIPAIKAKHKCDNVDFKVVLKDGKAMLKAVPK